MECNEPGLRNSYYYFFTPSPFYERLGFYVTVCGDFHASNGYRISRGGGVVPLLFFIRSGSLDLEYENQTYKACSGQIVLINCNRKHSYRVSDNCDFTFFHLSGSNTDDIVDMLITTNESIIFDPPDAAGMIRRSYDLLNILNAGSSPEESDMSSFVYEVLCHLYSKGMTDLMQKKSAHADISRTLAYIRENIKEEFSLEKLADISSMSKYHFLRTFKSQMGITPFQYINEMRISLAKTMLTATNMTIAEIAYDLGYSNESAFIRAFSRTAGTTPRKYRIF